MKINCVESFEGIIEVDEAFIGGKAKFKHKKKRKSVYIKDRVYRKRGRSFEDKAPVLGILSKDSKQIKLFTIPNTTRKTIQPIVFDNVVPGSTIHSDEWWAYKNMKERYFHEYIEHSKGVYCDGDVHTNTLEGAWSHLKRTITGTYHQVSRKYLQAYCDEFAFRYNTKHLSNKDRFELIFSNLDMT